jgi:uncharacterized phage protein (TIGR01671 family)
MRDILFRGKTLAKGGWIYGDLIRDDDDVCILQEGLIWREIIPESVGQYAGLKDKNGTRIFEGDIIKQVIPHNLVQPFIFTVNWCEECAMFVLPCITNDAFESDFTVMRSDEIEVIGNIYDNPELLEGE